MYISCINAASSHFYFPAELAGHFSNSISFAPGNHPVNCSGCHAQVASASSPVNRAILHQLLFPTHLPGVRAKNNLHA